MALARVGNRVDYNEMYRLQINWHLKLSLAFTSKSDIRNLLLTLTLTLTLTKYTGTNSMFQGLNRKPRPSHFVVYKARTTRVLGPLKSKIHLSRNSPNTALAPVGHYWS